MRDFLKSSGRWLRTGWIWPLALLVLPMCGLQSGGIPCDGSNCGCEGSECGGDGDGTPDELFDPGDEPTSAIMCDIPVFYSDNPGCATAADLLSYPAITGNALALNLGEVVGDTALDYSPDAIAACGGPRRVQIFGWFPDGLAVCLNCGQIPTKYADANKACIAKCRELNSSGLEFPADEVDPFCEEHAHTSTNFALDACWDNICTNAGNPNTITDDPRRDPEKVIWTDGEHVTVEDNDLSFDGPYTGDFSGGAASVQLITEGDAWVEFETGETDVSHVVGLRSSCSDIINQCPDGDETLGDIPLSLSLNITNNDVNIILNGAVLAGPFPPYAAGERFRIQAVDGHDGKANILFFRSCAPNSTCDPPFYTYTGTERPMYPLRVDATFRELNASIKNVTIMRIIAK